MEVTLPPPSSSSLEYQFPESPTKGQTSLSVKSGVLSLFGKHQIDKFYTRRIFKTASYLRFLLIEKVSDSRVSLSHCANF